MALVRAISLYIYARSLSFIATRLARYLFDLAKLQLNWRRTPKN